MPRSLEQFEAIARAIASVSRQEAVAAPAIEVPSPDPFDKRNIHPDLPSKVRTLFDDGHYPEATSLAFKYLEKKVQKYSGLMAKSGEPLMMEALDGNTIKLNALVTVSEKGRTSGLSVHLRRWDARYPQSTCPRADYR